LTRNQRAMPSMAKSMGSTKTMESWAGANTATQFFRIKPAPPSITRAPRARGRYPERKIR